MQNVPYIPLGLSQKAYCWETMEPATIIALAVRTRMQNGSLFGASRLQPWIGQNNGRDG
jgi:hypothetical protein